MSDSIENEILEILAKHTQLERGKVNAQTELDGIGVDSLVMVEIIFALEERFDINFPDPDFIGNQKQQFATASDVIRLVKDLIEQQKAQ